MRHGIRALGLEFPPSIEYEMGEISEREWPI